MDSFDALAKNEYTYADMLRYYKNVWNRNLVARTIDVQTDTVLKAIDPNTPVQHENAMMPVKERLEHRKILVQDALDLIAGIDALIALTPEDYVAKCLTKEALAVAEDMLPPKQKVGDACEVDGKPGTLQDDGKGNLTCVVTTEPAPAATDTVAPKVEGGEAPAPEAQV